MTSGRFIGGSKSLGWGAPVDIGGGLIVSEWLEVEAESISHGPDTTDSEYTLRARGAFDPETGKYEIQAIHVTPNVVRITSEGLRTIPIDLLRDKLAHSATIGYIDDEGRIQDPRDKFAVPYRRQDEHYRRIGMMHGYLLLGHTNPMATLSEWLDVSHATAYRWSKEARKRGLMEPRWSIHDPKPILAKPVTTRSDPLTPQAVAS